jgi:hypothetical protein
MTGSGIPTVRYPRKTTMHGTTSAASGGAGDGEEAGAALGRVSVEAADTQAAYRAHLWTR